MRSPSLLLIAAACVATPARPATADDPAPLVERYLIEGKLADGEKALTTALEKDPKDAQARFGLGVLQFLRGVERLSQGLYRYGLKTDGPGNFLPFLRLPIPANPAPEPVRYEDLRGLFRAWADDLARAEATLAKLDDDAVRLPLHFGRVHLDLDGDGVATGEEALWKVYEKLTRPGAATAEGAQALLITFDRGDVAWLRGYCHALSAAADVYLAHDCRDLFNHSAHLVFARPETPFPFLKSRKFDRNRFEGDQIIDLIATVHMIRLPVEDPRRMASALAHLEAVVRLSRESWSFYMKETDDDHEWIPNPTQHTVMPDGQVTDAMVKDWLAMLDEADAILAGKKLLPFWRDVPKAEVEDVGAGADEPGRRPVAPRLRSVLRRLRRPTGVNLRRVFTEPHGFDLVLWVQGTAAAPYLEKGTVTDPEFWLRLNRSFRGQLPGFAVWFN
jgi:hypothetical protein